MREHQQLLPLLKNQSFYGDEETMIWPFSGYFLPFGYSYMACLDLANQYLLFFLRMYIFLFRIYDNNLGPMRTRTWDSWEGNRDKGINGWGKDGVQKY